MICYLFFDKGAVLPYPDLLLTLSGEIKFWCLSTYYGLASKGQLCVWEESVSDNRPDSLEEDGTVTLLEQHRDLVDHGICQKLFIDTFIPMFPSLHKVFANMYRILHF